MCWQRLLTDHTIRAGNCQRAWGPAAGRLHDTKPETKRRAIRAPARGAPTGRVPDPVYGLALRVPGPGVRAPLAGARAGAYTEDAIALGPAVLKTCASQDRFLSEGKAESMNTSVTLTPPQRALLDERHYAVIATLNADGSIQQTVVWYLLDGDVICFSVGDQSVKARNLRRTPTISITIEDGIRYLSLQGEAIVEPSDPALRLRLAQRYLAPERVQEWLTRRPDAPRASVRVAIRRVYGQGV